MKPLKFQVTFVPAALMRVSQHCSSGNSGRSSKSNNLIVNEIVVYNEVKIEVCDYKR